MEVQIINENTIKDKIHIIRGVKVMLDYDLAEIYGYTTKAFNQQVRNNIEKFDDDFMFLLSQKEVTSLRSKFLTSNVGRGGSRYLPYAFTEQGIYMLMTVLKGDLAYTEIFCKAKYSIYIMDDYINIKTLHLLQGADKAVKVTIISDNIRGLLRQSDLKDFRREAPNLCISFIKNEKISHDRFIVLDYNSEGERLYHCGPSSKDAGNKTGSILEYSDERVKRVFHEDLEKMLANMPLELP